MAEATTGLDVYRRLASALDNLASGFPSTAADVELRVLASVFTPAEADVAAALTGRPAAAADVARRAGIDVATTTAVLQRLAERDIIWTGATGDGPGYRLAPFAAGFYEAHLLATRDPEFARLVDEYFAAGGMAGMMSVQPASHRIVPARSATDTEWVLPYDDVRALLATATAFRVEECACRVQQDMAGTRRCSFPRETCLWFSFAEPPDGSGAVSDEEAAELGAISHEEALALLDEAERIGLVHTVGNVASGVGYICNCCGCCCGVLRAVNEVGVELSVAQANYFAEIDGGACTACGTCQERCQVNAIEERGDGVRVVLKERCIGCGLCVTGCPDEAARLRRKPEGEIVVPPDTFAVWEQRRLRARGIGDA